MSIPDDDDVLAGETLTLTLGSESAGGRLDKTLAEHLPALSRARIQALMAAGLVTRGGMCPLKLSQQNDEGPPQGLRPPNTRIH